MLEWESVWSVSRLYQAVSVRKWEGRALSTTVLYRTPRQNEKTTHHTDYSVISWPSSLPDKLPREVGGLNSGVCQRTSVTLHSTVTPGALDHSEQTGTSKVSIDQHTVLACRLGEEENSPETFLQRKIWWYTRILNKTNPVRKAVFNLPACLPHATLQLSHRPHMLMSGLLWWGVDGKTKYSKTKQMDRTGDSMECQIDSIFCLLWKKYNSFYEQCQFYKTC